MPSDLDWHLMALGAQLHAMSLGRGHNPKVLYDRGVQTTFLNCCDAFIGCLDLVMKHD